MDDSILNYCFFQVWQNRIFDLKTWSAGVCYTYNPPDKSDTLLTSRRVREKCQRWNIIVKNQRLIALIGNNDQLENSSYPLEGRLEQDQEKMRILQLSSWLIIDQSGLSERFHQSEWSSWCRMSKLSQGQGLKVSRSKGLKVSRSQGLKVSRSQGHRVSGS